MNAGVFAEWTERQGYRTIKTQSTYWCEASPRVFQAFPYHWVVEPDERELSKVLRHAAGVCLRYSNPLGSPAGCVSYHAVCSRKGYDLCHFDKNTCKNVRRGLTNCAIKPIPFERLAIEGWELEADTSERQGRESRFTNRSFIRAIRSAVGLPGFEAWGAIADGRLAAYIMALRVDDTIEMLLQACCRDCLKRCINHALAYTVTREFLQRDTGIRSVFYGLQSLDAPASVDDFKFRLGYKPVAVRQRVVFHPWFTPVAVRFGYACLRMLSRHMSWSRAVAKGLGLFRFHLQGKQPLLAQEWPTPLLGLRSEMMNRPG